ncbi:hypothetical protein Sgly_1542 [Syntrophobotulus glycolicus DSM 8271]|uniref:Pyridoxamine 5'-phosphate oxidase-related FMN-binding protein n=1 Tax=Syntrophobotulus glycolicus (strain DSM 8271 / FlGlyR) TaxID=645991 RepID=F0SXK9_SYNGF|nr:hypothetical protein [Syntrophobotulus glycolicus]ADY55842.1 hypothetical protein Sgly_1542 [Syntrophobotulus glycolicus DSM 8271]
MSIQLEDSVAGLLNDKDTLKVLATTDQNGVPHAVVKQSLRLGEDGNIVYLELLESSQTYKNLIGSIWFNRKVAVILKGKDGRSYQIKGSPVKAIVAGKIFEENYSAVRERLGDVDLAAVWIIQPEEVINETFSVRQGYEEANRPFFKHLDRLAKKDSEKQERT